MYVNRTPKLRRYIINRWKLGITPVSQIARDRRVPRRTIYYLIERYKKYLTRKFLGRVHHPQTNGKIDRWFGKYKQEYDERFERLHQELDILHHLRNTKVQNY